MLDKFEQNQPGLDSPAANFFAVTPNDGADLAISTRGISVAVTGTVKVDGQLSGTAVVLQMVAGIVYPYRVKRIYAAGTSATGIVGMY